MKKLILSCLTLIFLINLGACDIDESKDYKYIDKHYNLMHKKTDINDQINNLELSKNNLYKVTIDYDDTKTKNAVKGYDYTDEDRYLLKIKDIQPLDKNEIKSFKNIKNLILKTVSTKYIEDNPKNSKGILASSVKLSDLHISYKSNLNKYDYIKFYKNKSEDEVKNLMSKKIIELKKEYVKLDKQDKKLEKEHDYKYDK